MKKGKYSVSSFGKLKGKRRMVAALALALILVCTVGGTLAYVFMDTDPVENKFTPSHVATKVVETFDKTTKSDVKIQNIGNTDAFIRAAIVVTWKKADGTVYAMKPVECTCEESHVETADCGYIIELGANWTKSGEYYYYNGTVAPDKMTSALINSCTPVAGKAPEGYKLSVEIVASGIQSTGMGATSVQDAWAKAPGNN